MTKRRELALYLIAVMVLATIAVLSISKPADADLWTAYKNSQLEVTEAIAYRVEALGFDVRTYEFRPKTAPDHTCVMAFGQTHPVGLQCFRVVE